MQFLVAVTRALIMSMDLPKRTRLLTISLNIHCRNTMQTTAFDFLATGRRYHRLPWVWTGRLWEWHKLRHTFAEPRASGEPLHRYIEQCDGGEFVITLRYVDCLWDFHVNEFIVSGEITVEVARFPKFVSTTCLLLYVAQLTKLSDVYNLLIS